MSENSNDGPVKFGWRAAFIGGAVTMGGVAFLGTLVTNISLWISISGGRSLNQAYASLSSGFFAPYTLFSVLGDVLAGFAGGYVSALYGCKRALMQGMTAGAISILFQILMILGPGGHVGPAWYVALSLVIPIASGAFGGYICARKAR